MLQRFSNFGPNFTFAFGPTNNGRLNEDAFVSDAVGPRESFFSNGNNSLNLINMSKKVPFSGKAKRLQLQKKKMSVFICFFFSFTYVLRLHVSW